eukprot:gb/GEZN01004070.1/.p1 GENE.gb/GEZN01004070.1/~~gb/GEZN01004070.1/.p1  ORF type:complete len:605 (-),score=84.65 gb/GEZN01004070.1/:179-1993(-)
MPELLFDPEKKSSTFLIEFLIGHNVDVPTHAKKPWYVEKAREILVEMASAEEREKEEAETGGVQRQSRRRSSARLASRRTQEQTTKEEPQQMEQLREEEEEVPEDGPSEAVRRNGSDKQHPQQHMEQQQYTQEQQYTEAPPTNKPVEDIGDGANWSTGMGNGSLIVPFFLMVCPFTAQLLAWITSPEAKEIRVDASAGLTGLWQNCQGRWVSCARTAWSGGWSVLPTLAAAKCLAAFFMLALTLDFLLPGKIRCGPITRTGHTPKYKENGFLHCVVFTALFLLGSNLALNLYDLGQFYDVFTGAIAILNISGLLFAGFLHWKGLNHPSTQDFGSSGSFLVDYYWGTELYPKVLGVDVKRFINCRLSMTFWMLAGISYTWRSYTLHDNTLDYALFFASLSQFLYLVKFFLWEVGYLNSIDIIVDRAGWEIQWGCLVWVPTVYTLHSRLLVQYPSGLSLPVAATIFTVGFMGVLINWWADVQRYNFRARNGKVKIFGRDPVYVEAHYTVRENGVEVPKTSLLLADGFWGPARHFHYCFELMAAWSWCLLANPFKNGALPLFYGIFLTILLLHRAKRDEEKCARKYGADYTEKFCKLVPYLVVPYIY